MKSLFTRARKYIDMNHVKELADQKLYYKKELEKIQETVLKKLTNKTCDEYSNWRHELTEGMTSGGMVQSTFGATGEVDLSDLPANDIETYSFADPTEAFFGGVAIRDSGTGTGSDGGFDLGQSYLSFNGDGLANGQRIAFLNKIDTSKFDTMVVTAIRGNDSNGGEDPDEEGAQLRLYYNTGDNFYDSITKKNGEVVAGVSDVIIPLGNDTADLRSWVVNLPDHVRTNSTEFAFIQNVSSGTGFDNYGITQIRFQRRAPVTVMVSLDDPDASSFVRTDPAFAGLTQEQKLKKLKKMLEDSDEYVKKIFGDAFPGTGATAPGEEHTEPGIEVTNYPPDGPTEDQDPSDKTFYDLYKDELEKSGKKPGERGATPYSQWLKTQTDKYIDPADPDEPDPDDPKNKPYDELTDDEKQERLKEINRRTRKANDPYYHTPDVDNLPEVVETVDGRRQVVRKIPPIPGDTGARTDYFNEHHTEAFDKDAALKYQQRNWQRVGAWRSWLNDWEYSDRYTEIGSQLSGLRIVPNSEDQGNILNRGDDYADAIDHLYGRKAMTDHINMVYDRHIASTNDPARRAAYERNRQRSLEENALEIKDAEKKLAYQKDKFSELLNLIREKTDEIRDPFVNGGDILEYIDTYVDDFPDEVNQLIKQGVDKNFEGLQDMLAQPDVKDVILKELMKSQIFRIGSTLAKLAAPASAKTFLDYLTGSLPEVIDNAYLGKDYVQSVLKKVYLKGNVVNANTLTEPDLIIGTGGVPKYDASTGEVILPFNYDFKTNEKEINDAAGAGQRIWNQVMTSPVLPTLDGFRSFYGLFGGTEEYSIDAIPVPMAAYFIEKAKKLGGAQKRTGEVKLKLSDIKRENPKFYQQLIDSPAVYIPTDDIEQPKAPKPEPRKPRDRRSQEAEKRRQQREKEKEQLGSVGAVGGVDATDAAAAAAERRRRRGSGIKESVQGKRLKSPSEVMKKIPGYYDGKPAPLGFPMEKPPEMINGFHPDLVDGKKVSQRFNRLDPVSARAMPPTGNPHIDKKVEKAKKKPK